MIAAHPAVPVPGSAWEFGYRDVDAIEVWNGPWNIDDEVSLRIWHRLLRLGRRVTAVGGSDSHGPHQRVGLPHTVVNASALGAPQLLDGLRQGRCYVAESAGVSVQLAASPGADATTRAGPGETLVISPHSPVDIEATVHGAPGTEVALITAAGRAVRACADGSGTGRLRWTTTGAGARFARVEVRRSPGGRLRSMVALTNPVWLREAAEPTQGRTAVTVR